MIELLASMTLSCADAAWIINGIRDTQLGKAEQAEIVLEVMAATDPNCDLSAALQAESRR